MQIMRSPKVIYRLLSVLLGLSLFASCSEWDTDSLGSDFVPANSQVRAFTHLVYVEYTPEGARVWGPSSHEVTATIDGLHVSIENASDSLALFAYGYPAAKDTLALTDASLSVQSPRAYALYLGGLALRSLGKRPVIESQGQAPCYLVMPQGSVNDLFGCVRIDGPAYLTGKGSLTINNTATCLTAATLQCQYDVKMTLNSEEGDGISLAGPMRSSLGTWTINAGRNGITTPDSIVLMAGTYQGWAVDGAFLDAAHGVLSRRATLMAASGWSNNIVDSAYVVQRYDSLQAIWQEQVETLLPDTTYLLYRNGAYREFAKFSTHRELQEPWFLLSNTTVFSTDTVHFKLEAKP